MKNEVRHTAHSSYRCEYHIVFAMVFSITHRCVNSIKAGYGNRHFWARGYYVDTVGRNKKQIKEYIQNQLREDRIADQMSIKEYVDPFTGSSNQKA